MPNDIRIEDLPALNLAVVRRLARLQDLSRVVPEACGRVWNVLRSHHAQGAGRHVAVYLDGEINLEVGVELDSPFAGFDDVVPSTTPAGRVVTTTHFGPYQQLSVAHDAIRAFCLNHGHALAGPSWEIYGHWQSAWNSDPAKIITDVCYLLRS
jgi:effector-binding domain-containing protein